MHDITSPGLPAALALPFGLVEDAFRRLTRRVSEMGQAELEFTGPAGNLNSTAMLLAHLALTDLYYLHCMKGVPVPPELEAEYGPAEAEGGDLLPEVTGKTAAELLAKYQRVIEMARSYLLTLPDADAEREVTVPWWPETATVRYVLWHMAGHSMFHQGHIARLQAWYRQQPLG